MDKKSNKLHKGATQGYLYAEGVLKFDYKAAGFPDLKAIAAEWAKDPNFYHISIRYVSTNNLGIDFLYFGERDDKKSTFREKFVDSIKMRFGKGMYAFDFVDNIVDDTNGLKENIFANKQLPFVKK